MHDPIKITIAAAVFAASAASCASKTPDEQQRSFTTVTVHTVINDVSCYGCPQYQWFIFEDGGNADNRKVLDSGISLGKAPEVNETEDKITVYFSDNNGEYMYREYDPYNGTMTELYQCITDPNGNRVCFSNTLGTFKYSDILKLYRNTPNANKDSFANLDTCELTDALSAYERARNEVNIPYNAAAAAFDESINMWQVIFYTIGSSDGDMAVYLDSNGKTKLIVTDQ